MLLQKTIIPHKTFLPSLLRMILLMKHFYLLG